MTADLRVCALVPDLMDRSRVNTAVPGVQFANDAVACAGADIVIIDLGRRADAVAEVRAVNATARIVAFGPHVDGPGFDAAEAAGADVVLARSRFFRDIAAAIAQT